MFAIKDLESLQNLSALLTVPFFVAGSIISKEIALQLDKPVEAFFRVFPDVFSGSFFLFLFIALNVLLPQVSSIIAGFATILFFLAGFAGLTIGLCQIPILIVNGMQGTILTHTIFWTLGYISAGFTLLNMAGSNPH